jgi:hypothetical protein
MFIEQRIESLTEAFNDFRVEMSGRLSRIETTQENTNDHLAKMNGSIAKSIDRIGELESDKKLKDGQILELAEASDINKKEIASLNKKAIYEKGKIAGMALIVSAVGTILGLLVGYFVHHGHAVFH